LKVLPIDSGKIMGEGERAEKVKERVKKKGCSVD